MTPLTSARCPTLAHLSCRRRAADLSSCMCVRRAIFTYDGFSNKLKLADSGGKNHPRVSMHQGQAAGTLTLTLPL